MFWAVAIGLAVVTAVLLALALRGTARGGRGGPASDVQVYRDQLSEVERDVARGTLGTDEAAQVRTEVSRRLIDADRAARASAEPTAAPAGLTGALAVLCVLIVVGGTIATYFLIGAPGYPDLPLDLRIRQAEILRANRPSQITVQQQAAVAPPDTSSIDPTNMAMIERLRSVMETRPDDLRGHELLADNEAALGNFAAAIAAQERVIALKARTANATDFAKLAQYMVAAAGGYVSPEAETALKQALARDPDNGTARYFSGLLNAQIDRPDLAFRTWRDLLEAGPEGAPWIAPIRAQIADLAGRAGVRYNIPAAPGPGADDMAAAADMSPEDRAAMIAGMVAGLADRLARQGGPPEDWARLIGAYGVLGRDADATAIYREALEVFADSEAALATLRAAAQNAGIAG